MAGEIPEKGVQQQSVGAGFQISKRQIHEQDRTLLIGLLTSDESVVGAKQNLTGVVAGSDEAGILQISIFVAPELDLEVPAGDNRWATLWTGGAAVRMEGIVFSRRYFHLTNNGTGACDLTPLGSLITKLVVKSVIHTRQVRQPGTSRGVSAIQRERAGIVDQHEFPAIGYEAMESCDENITRLLVNRVRQNHSCTLRLSPQRTEKLGVMNRNHMKSF